ncbi:hypothetical protein [Xiashengella succiniciproducens]|jgi:hypothetical protein|uniref:Carboxypeptidase-like regulatory domain-containing protein n=1 Tax=Xiashengella succiniciproducens TaxID=2949635 RepID=A0A9J6ZT90_9BACT|nr:hypothetical protein [Alkaliflexus sp. Ai-910]URW80885.1 hypothetical protein M9189_05915 [Alkaliflexus sp. Ai-910]URW80948.1 hypothetical protein M9189_06230 [Alkaliflexus sp. Ai-910]
MKQIIGLAILTLLFSSCSNMILGKYRMSIMPPYLDYTFGINRFTHYVNGDVYGEFGKGTYSIENDTLTLNFIDLKNNETIVSIRVDSAKQDKFHYNFRIVDKDSKDTFIGANVVIYNSKDSIINEGMTNYDGELVLTGEQRADKIIVSYIGYDEITITDKFGYTNTIYIEWNSDWLRKIGESTKKYQVLEKNRNIIRLRNLNNDTISLIRKRLSKKLDKGKITREKFIKKIE